MAEVQVFTAERSQAIEDNTIVDAEIVGGELILKKHDETEINVGTVVGADGAAGSSTVETLPAYTTLTIPYASGTGPSRPTTRTDIIVRWRGPNAPANALSGDEFVSTV